MKIFNLFKKKLMLSNDFLRFFSCYYCNIIKIINFLYIDYIIKINFNIFFKKLTYKIKKEYIKFFIKKKILFLRCVISLYRIF